MTLLSVFPPPGPLALRRRRCARGADRPASAQVPSPRPLTSARVNPTAPITPPPVFHFSGRAMRHSGYKDGPARNAGHHHLCSPPALVWPAPGIRCALCCLRLSIPRIPRILRRVRPGAPEKRPTMPQPARAAPGPADPPAAAAAAAGPDPPLSRTVVPASPDIEHYPVVDDPRLWSEARKWSIVATLSCGSWIPATSANILFPALPEIEQSLHTVRTPCLCPCPCPLLARRRRKV